ncbi:hypothetical protein EW145_g180 [Phellinidium pouzarii]|uniref:Uncharacterized protein n=1 Tax=Phellinidium pouzarii TaxID=167371 RepID=A0A4S4LPV6_9AGAM|nr:hypothetical protein EW145_g180 [Phellinidium pouzarii]
MESNPEDVHVDDSTHDYSCLQPTTPTNSTRYTKSGGVTLSNRNICPGLFSRQGEPEPVYLARGWSSHVHAEGQLYFYHSGNRVVTETNIYDQEKLARITHWTAVIRELARERNIAITDSIEVMLELDAYDEDSCKYYLVEHDSDVVFWLHEVTSDDLGFPESTSFAQLRWASTEQYWTHVEYFSVHLSGVKMSCARELVSILTHAIADHLTSLVGTFPYGAAQCKKFVDLLRDHVSSSSEYMTDPYIICVVARLWAQVARHRFYSYYGEENARLSRDQRIVNVAPKEPPLIVKYISKTVFFSLPSTFTAELDGLWVDDLVYSETWQQFIVRCIADWKESAIWTLVMSLFHVLFYFARVGSRSIAIASLALSIVGFISSLILTSYHRLPLDFKSVQAAVFLDKVYHPKYGFAQLSFVYSVPKALLFWSTGLLMIQMGFAMVKITDIYIASGLIALTVVLACIIVVWYRRRASSTDVDSPAETEQVSSWESESRGDYDLEKNIENSMPV